MVKSAMLNSFRKTVPAIGFCVFMLVVTNIKNPNRKIDKLQREYLLRFYDESGKMK